MPKISEAEMGRIALKIVISRMAKDNEILDKNDLKRGVPNMAKALGEKPEVLEAFVKEILPEVVRVRLGCEGVTLHWKEDKQ
jgi:hypothetical protein